jgi:hypothetical protein
MEKESYTEKEYRETTVLVALANSLDGVLYSSLPFKKAHELRGRLFDAMRLQLSRLSENSNTVIQ